MRRHPLVYSIPLSWNKSSRNEFLETVADCLRQVERSKRWKQIRLSGRQSLYLGALLFFLLAFASRSLFPPEGPFKQIPLATATTFTFTPDPWEGYLKFNYYVSPEDSLKELAEDLNLSMEDIVELNHMRADSLLSLRVLSLVVPESSFTPPAQIQVPALPNPLTAQDDMGAILERMARAQQLMSTLWGDYRFILYGPSGYSGPPFLESRMQVWWHQQDHLVMISGMNSVGTSEVQTQYSISSGFSFDLDRSSGSYFGYRNQAGFDPAYFFNPTALIGLDEGKATLKVVGSDRILGRLAIVFDWLQGDDSNSARVWIDAERGLVLRLRLFEDDSMQVTMMDFGFSDLALDFDLPDNIFSPNHFRPQGFVVDYSGQPSLEGSGVQPASWSLPNDRRPRHRNSPPQGFDPLREPLTMQWPMEGDDSNINMVDIFAGEYYMGSLNFGQGAAGLNQDYYASIPFISCTRSPDGRLVAVSTSRLSSYEPRLYWFKLANPADAQFVTSTSDTTGEFAFDPSSRYLAYYGCSDGVCGLQILDTLTDTSHRLANSVRFGLGSLTWSPDGKYLAFLGSGQGSSPRKIYVLRVSDGYPVYEAEYGWETGSIPSDSPTHSWGIPFPTRESIFPLVEGCRFPLEYPHSSGNDRLE